VTGDAGLLGIELGPVQGQGITGDAQPEGEAEGGEEGLEAFHDAIPFTDTK
jgi:hypothetical protein